MHIIALFCFFILTTTQIKINKNKRKFQIKRKSSLKSSHSKKVKQTKSLKNKKKAPKVISEVSDEELDLEKQKEYEWKELLDETGRKINKLFKKYEKIFRETESIYYDKREKLENNRREDTKSTEKEYHKMLASNKTEDKLSEEEFKNLIGKIDAKHETERRNIRKNFDLKVQYNSKSLESEVMIIAKIFTDAKREYYEKFGITPNASIDERQTFEEIKSEIIYRIDPEQKKLNILEAIDNLLEVLNWWTKYYIKDEGYLGLGITTLYQRGLDLIMASMDEEDEYEIDLADHFCLSDQHEAFLLLECARLKHAWQHLSYENKKPLYDKIKSARSDL